ncbi:MAG: D-alanyl-D-alanine carboxypeptidase/D-alanyl-D-alanine-endopeptidase [Candidatus Sumerlaeaceae bacterium]|nr:D-alanyl-D-alanine carboxypeptidase/D-alanyl-D-alanine-endopeptidase [Candidatus Sumerlaeaceae bacterium]
MVSSSGSRRQAALAATVKTFVAILFAFFLIGSAREVGAQSTAASDGVSKPVVSSSKKQTAARKPEGSNKSEGGKKPSAAPKPEAGKKPEEEKKAAVQSQKKSARSSRTRASKPPVSRPDPVTSTTPATLPEAVERIVAPVAGQSRWGIVIKHLESGAVLYSHAANEKFIPASNRKIFTGALALDQLGPDFQYRTYLYRTGAVDANGVLQGSLVIRPQGDPSFTRRLWQGQPDDWIYRDWVEKVRAQGIREVAGELVVDCSEWDLADLIPRGWPERVRDDYYAPIPSPLTLKENLLEIRVRPGAPGQPGIVEFIPAATGYPVINDTVTGQGKAGVTVKRAKNGQIVVSGNPTEATAKRTFTIPCDNPGLYAAAVFRQKLHDAKIPVRGSLRVASRPGTVPPPTTDNVVAVYLSPKMSEIVDTMMKQSNNHFAEQLYVSIGALKRGRGGYRSTKEVEAEFLRRAGIEPREMGFEDGSGLSEQNRVSPAQVVALLEHMSRHPYAAQFFASLPLGGREGTLRGRMRNDHTAGKVRAKTGYINAVSCLSGYVTAAPGRTLVFSFLFNNIRTSTDAVKGTQDRLCELLCLLEM